MGSLTDTGVTLSSCGLVHSMFETFDGAWSRGIIYIGHDSDVIHTQKNISYDN